MLMRPDSLLCEFTKVSESQRSGFALECVLCGQADRQPAKRCCCQAMVLLLGPNWVFAIFVFHFKD